MANFMQKYIFIVVARIYYGVQGHMLDPPVEIRKMWCSLVRFGVYFDQSVS